jgi:hypothetical protein
LVRRFLRNRSGMALKTVAGIGWGGAYIDNLLVSQK